MVRQAMKAGNTGVLPRGEAGGRSAEEYCAADPAEEHGLLEADHRASWRAGRCQPQGACDNLVCAPKLVANQQLER